MKLEKTVVLAALFCIWCSAAPVAKVTAVQGLLINGKPVPDNTAPTWPIVGNDGIVTAAKSAVLVLPKADRAQLEPQTSVRLLDNDGVLTVEVVSGEVCFVVHSKSPLHILPPDAASSISYPFDGSVSLRKPGDKASVSKGGCHLPAAAFLPAHKAVVGTAAAIGGIGAGTAAALSTGKSVPPASPSQP